MSKDNKSPLNPAPRQLIFRVGQSVQHLWTRGLLTIQKILCRPDDTTDRARQRVPAYLVVGSGRSFRAAEFELSIPEPPRRPFRQCQDSDDEDEIFDFDTFSNERGKYEHRPYGSLLV